MSNDEEDINIREMFNKIAEMLTNNMNEAQYKGDCNCCFLFELGHHVMYRYSNGDIAQLFICIQCSNDCSPEGQCEVSNFEETHNIYVSEKN